ncbi:hypothetical protein ES708_15279 [subsurface metagenome]
MVYIFIQKNRNHPAQLRTDSKINLFYLKYCRIWNILAVLFFFYPEISVAQLNENFENGNLTGWEESVPGRWAASEKNPISGNFSLHHIYDNSTAGHDQISYPAGTISLESGNTTWQFQVKHGYPPSAANNWGVFLISDKSAGEMYPSGEASGYLTGVNYSGSDDFVKIWKVTSGTGTEILNTNFNWQENIGTSQAIGFEIIRSASGEWEVKIDTNGGFDHLTSFGIAYDSDYTTFWHFGIYYEYSSSQDQKFWIDDIVIDGPLITDTIPPTVKNLKPVSSNLLEIEFSEPVLDTSAVNPDHYLVDNSIGNPDSVIRTEPYRVRLMFETDFQDGNTYNITLEKILDLFNNPLPFTTKQFVYHIPKAYEVVINEIMADPNPPVGLPDFEYLELYNVGEYDININGWILAIGSKKIELMNREISAGSYLILCSKDAADELDIYGETYGIAEFPSLLNNGQMITLINQSGQVIHSVKYCGDWYKDEFKAEGGWSLEQIDPLNPCGEESNWIASVDLKGGTPGQVNSVNNTNPDFIPPFVKRAIVVSDSVLQVVFSETYDTVSASNPDVYTVDHGIGNPGKVKLFSPGYKKILLYFDSDFDPILIYSLEVKNLLTDCAGNRIEDENQTLFGISQHTDSLDIIINEVLFDPLPGGVDYVEVFNTSEKILDMREIKIATRDDFTGKLKSLKSISEESILFFPKEYLVLTEDMDKVRQQYFTSASENFIELEGLPPFNNEKGRVVISDQWFNIIDEFAYNKDMHFPLLNSVEGVSLERVNFNRPTNERSNWHSAAEDAGFGTPGYKNSQFVEDPLASDEIKIEPEVFSPDNDGYKDIVNICYSYSEPGYIANIIVFDMRGRLVKKIVENELLGTRGIFSWDGINEGNRKAGIGLYLFYIEVFDLKGNVKKYKKICVLAGKLR